MYKLEAFNIRKSQLIAPFGIGSLVDINNQSIIIHDSESWKVNMNEIIDIRLQTALKSTGFVDIPVTKESDTYNADETIKSSRFPNWYFNPINRQLKTIDEWQTKITSKLEKKFYETPFTNYDDQLIPVRVLCACPDGHIQDFPWMNWCHEGAPDKLSNHSLSLKSRGSSSSISDLIVTCSCGKWNSLNSIFNKDQINDTFKKIHVSCEGKFLWKTNETPKKCDCDLHVLLRNQNNLHFPVIKSSVNIPLIDNTFEESVSKHTIYGLLNDSFTEFKDFEEFINNEDSKFYVKKLSESLDSSKNRVIQSLRNLLVHDSNTSVMDYKSVEFDVLTGKTKPNNDSLAAQFNFDIKYPSDFPNHSYKKIISNITLVKKVEIVNALVGYSRINTFESENMIDDTENENLKIVSLKRKDGRYVANKSRGEGIFISLSPDMIDKWYQYVLNRDENILKDIQNKTVLSKYAEHSNYINPKFYLLHTLSHLLIKELTNSSGYSSSSLKERLYFDEEIDMYGIFIYTSSNDDEGTLGGLVKQGLPSKFFQVLEKAIDDATWCSYDPVCIENKYQGRDSLNLASCHACSLISETSCEFQNVYLDRKLLVGSLTDHSLGFFTGINSFDT